MMKVGVIGCGNIADIYFKNSKQYFNNFEIVACADIKEEASKSFAEKYNVRQLSVEDMLADSEIEFIINLTIPNVHYEVSKSILESKKHSYSEKPLSIEFDDGKKLNELAENNNVYVGCAPDTFLGAGIQTARKLIDDNAIGKVQLGSISMAVPGHEIWHPNPDFYYQYGGGPILDMGPYYFTALVNLLGPVVNVDSKIKAVYEKRVKPEDLPFFSNLMSSLNKANFKCPAPVINNNNSTITNFNGKKLMIREILAIDHFITQILRLTLKTKTESTQFLHMLMCHKMVEKTFLS